MNESHPLRVFLGYGHEDSALAADVERVLVELGHVPWRDTLILAGTDFTEAIQKKIATSHVFMPLLTDKAEERPWVHQEIGYALASHIPVLPVAVGTAPAQMLRTRQAIHVTQGGEELEDRLKTHDYLNTVLSGRTDCVEGVVSWREERPVLIADHANKVRSESGPSDLRQRAAFSSFSIPDAEWNDGIWADYDGDHPLSRQYHDNVRKERQALEWHARNSRCRLIIDPTVDFSSRGKGAHLPRLENLHGFLASMDDESTEVAFSKKGQQGNVTIVGDWFACEAQLPSAREGLRQTVFSWHAPSVLKYLRDFDDDFSRISNGEKVEPASSRRRAMDRIAELIEAEKAKP